MVKKTAAVIFYIPLKVYKWCTATRLRKILSLILITLITLTSLRFLFLLAKEVRAADVYLGLDEGYGTSSAVHDTNNTVSAGSITGAVWKQEEFCKSGKCLFFDGTGDYISFSDNANLDMGAGETVTIEGWFRTPDITSGSRTLVSKYETTGSGDGGYRIYINSSGQVVYGIDNANSFPSDFVTSTSAYDDNAWHHFAAVKNGATSITLYIDGQSVGAPDTSIQNDISNDDSYYVGRYESDTAQDFKGFIDEVKVLRSARTADQIKADYNGETLSDGTSASFGPDNSWLTNGLVGYWKMEEAGDADRTDSSGNGNILTESTSDTVTQTSGKFGNAGDFEIDDTEHLAITDANQKGMDITGSISVCSWIKLESTGIYQWFVTKYDGTSGNQRAYELDISNGNKLRFYLSADGGIVNYNGETGDTVLTASNWYHACGVYDGTKISVYLNGKLDSIPTNYSLGIFNSNADFRIGTNGDGTYPHDGAIDDVRVYNRALSPAEVQKLYNWAPGPDVYINFDEAAGNSAFDQSTNAAHAVFDGGTANPQWRPGKFGSSLYFDGVDDNTTSTHATVWDVNTTDNVTYEMWIYMAGPTNSSGGYLIGHRSGALFYMRRISETTYQLCWFSIESDCGDTLTYEFNHWYHVAMVKEASSRVSFYRDGISAGIDSVMTEENEDESGMNIMGNVANWRFNGNIDELRFYRYARTPAQIVEDMLGSPQPAGGGGIGSLLNAPVGYWNFDEGYSTTLNNTGSGGSAYNASFSTSGSYPITWSNEGKFGKALSFGTQSMAKTSTYKSSLNYNGIGGLTIGAWIKANSGESNGGDIVSKAWNGSGEYNYRFRYLANNTLQVALAGSTTYSLTTTDTVSANTWHYVVFSINGSSNEVNIYIDGRLSKTGTNTISNWTPTSGDTSKVLAIGCIYPYTNDCDAGTANAFYGLIDEVKIYSFALTADQVKTDYNQGTNTVMGSTSTDSSGNPSWSATDEYCPPGQGTTCVPPVAHWKMDENQGNYAEDSSGNNNRGTLTNNPTWLCGKIGSGIKLEADNRYVNAPSISPNITGKILTVEGWINLNLTGTVQRIFINGSSNPHFGITNANQIFVHTTTSAGTDNNTPMTALPTSCISGWHHISVTWDSDLTADNVKVYCDGYNFANGTLINAKGGTFNVTAAKIGYDSSSQSISGAVDDFRIYNYARSPAQIAWDYNKGGPVAWWQIDEGSGDTANNNSKLGSVINGDLAGAGTTCPSAGSCPTWSESGKINSALDFDGVDDYSGVAANDPLKLTSGGTISAWVYPHGQGDSVYPRIVDKSTSTGGVGGYALDLNAGATTFDPMLEIENVNDKPSLNLPYNHWYHIAVTFNGNSWVFYVNGNLVKTASNSGLPSDTSANVSVGNRSGATDRSFDGLIDDVRIYNYALTAQQVKTVMNDGSAIRFQ